jgi:imidazolonepropionase-like amidohydrolase
MKKIILYICFLAAANIALAQQHIAIVGATAHLGTGVVIENSLILIKDGKIEEVTTAERPVPKIYRFIDAKGKHVYPGAIAAATRVGLEEIEAVRATLDYQEVGSFNPHIRSLIAYNTDSKIIPTLRFNGVLTVQSIPFGGWISGTSSVFRLNGWNWQDAVLATDEGLWLNWPNTYNNSGWWA